MVGGFSCLKNATDVDCPTIETECSPSRWYYLPNGLLLTTRSNISKALESEQKVLVQSKGSVYVEWQGITHIDIAGVQYPDMGTFYPPQLKGQNNTSISIIEPVGFFNGSSHPSFHTVDLEGLDKIEEDVKKRNKLELIWELAINTKDEYFSKTTHIVFWVILGILFIFLVIACLLRRVCCATKGLRLVH